MTTPARNSMTAASRWASEWRHTLALLGSFAIATAGALHAPEWLVDKIGHVAEHVWSDPQGFAASLAVVVGAVAGAIVALRAAWLRDPRGDR